MKLKYWLTIPLGFLFLNLVLDFSEWVLKFRLPNTVETFAYETMAVLTAAFLIYLYMKYMLKESWSDLYICKPLPRLKWVMIGIAMSTFVLLCCIFLTEGTFQKEDHSLASQIQIVLNTCMISIRAGFMEEMIFRGLMFSSLKKASGTKVAVILSSVLFAVLHLGNIEISLHNIISLIVAITLCGIAFCLITLETGSIWSAVVFHAVYDIISGDLDIIHVSAAEAFPAVWKYTPVREYRWITGIIGSDDIETGLPAMIGMILVSLLALYWIKKKQKMNENTERKSAVHEPDTCY